MKRAYQVVGREPEARYDLPCAAAIPGPSTIFLRDLSW